jgi:hypothetical protein
VYPWAFVAVLLAVYFLGVPLLYVHKTSIADDLHWFMFQTVLTGLISFTTHVLLLRLSGYRLMANNKSEDIRLSSCHSLAAMPQSAQEK